MYDEHIQHIQDARQQLIMAKRATLVAQQLLSTAVETEKHARDVLYAYRQRLLAAIEGDDDSWML